MRVVSLLPSATEILCAIGAGDLLVGRSHECDWPPAVLSLPVVTGQRGRSPTGVGASAAIDQAVRETMASGDSLYRIDEGLLTSLRPDLILTQDLCDVCSVDLATVRRLCESMHPKPTVLSLNPSSFWDVLDDILRVGDAVSRAREAQAEMVRLRERWWTIVDHVNPFIDGPEVLFLEWMDPPFVAGHWTPQLIEAAGAKHSLNKAGAKSRVASPEEILEAAPERIIIAPCGYSIEQIRAQLGELQRQRWWSLLPANLGPSGRVAIVDGNQMFNRPGPRLVDAFGWLSGWLNDRPELVPERFPVEIL